MRLESKKYLFDIKQAADLLADFTRAKSFEIYQEDPRAARSAVSRQFEGQSVRRCLSSPS